MTEDVKSHFIKNIEIKNFKCFDNFKAEGFGRVNLIGGKNNVGKTAFMEVCYLGLTEDKGSKEFIEKSIVIELHRNSLNFLLAWIQDYEDFSLKYNKIAININKELESSNTTSYTWDPLSIPNTTTRAFNEYLKSFYKKGTPPIINNINFISGGNNITSYLIKLIDKVKLKNKEDDLNNTLNDLFEILKIDIIQNEVMLKKGSDYYLLSEYGDGVKHFLNIILSLYLNENSILFIDEIENGIHYTNLDKLWEIILTISKEQNVQVFATTHSKECIESYARVAKRLEETDIKFLSLYRNKNNELKSITFDYKKIQDRIELGLDNR